MRRTTCLLALLFFALPFFAEAQTTTQRGVASVYSEKFIGHVTASGAVLDRHSLTAAHLSLPMGSVIKVTNRRNGRSIIVTVNDRGPYRKGRIIDLSPVAARQLGIRGGLTPVVIRVLA